MTFVSYAQNFEDVLLWRALHDVENGRYLDIGAQDPVIDSVSLAFYEAGWRGVHVEPTPTYADRLREARPDEVVIQAAVTDADKPIELYEFPGTGLSTGIADIAKRHATAGFAQRKIVVPSIRLRHLIDTEGPDFHWVKIDVEGMEHEALRSWDESERRPWVFVVEATYPLSQKPTHKAWVKELSIRGYREVHFDGLSRYFLHESQASRSKAFEASANVFDEFAITRRHFSAVSLNDELDTVERRLEEQQTHALELQSQLTVGEQQLEERQAQSAELQSQLTAERQRLEERQAQSAELQSQLAAERQQLEERQTQLAELQSQLAAERQRLIEEQEKSASSQAQAVRAEQERDAARAQQIATYDAWVQGEREHQQHVEKLWSERAGLELQHRAELERLRLGREATERSLRQEYREKESRLSGDLDQARTERDGLELKVLELKDRLADVETLITRALAVPPGGWQRLGRVLGFARDDAVEAMLLSWTSDSSRSNVQPVEPGMSVARSPETKPYLHANSLSELLSLDGQDFVQSAYATMLGREADPEGEAYYLGRLKNGIPKLQILHQMRKSPEAKLLLDPLPGLDETLRAFRLSSWFRGRKGAAEALEARVSSEGDRAHVQQFMQYHDEEFVRVVYLYYLGRQPDQPGLEYYLYQLRRGVSRQQVLVDITKSNEAKLRGRAAVGQTAVETAIVLDKIPVIGTLISILRFNIGIKNHLQDIRALQNYLYRFAKKIG